MPAFQPRFPWPFYAVLLIVSQNMQMVAALPTLSARSDTATSGGGLTQSEKITLYVVAAVGGLFAILGAVIYVLRTRHLKECRDQSQKMTQSLLKTLPIIQYNNGSGHSASTRSSSIVSDDSIDEKIENQRNTACPICTDDFIENQMLRILPCEHQYHMKCIGDWLSRGSSCPVCRIELKLPIKKRSAKHVDLSDVEQTYPRANDGHAKKLHNRLLRHLYSVGLGQHYNSA
ncbi:DNA damage-inducible protein 1 [Penicillium manginii]|uniref:DNA damage-inducible protein 1 n=1 Tax=Penicillium manginii TaxID=203109 RepID=UPI002548D245|nr:DNA damage-inducible protein 1 [Penicillium manginii]KAJ5741713.1 DNA damage-inducible protein 1 [Penicillium manginii]